MAIPPINDVALAKQFLQGKTIPAGAVGLWYIPSLSVCIPVYNAKAWDAQQVIDAANSAAYCRYSSCMDIGDHYASGSSWAGGKWRLEQVQPLSTAYFKQKDGITRYECYQTAVADVKYGYYYIGSRMLTPGSSKDIICSCCVEIDSSRNYLAIFRYIGKV